MKNLLHSMRLFGALITVMFAIAAARALIKGSDYEIFFLLSVVSIAFGLATVFFPSALRPVYRAWTSFGELLGRVVNPVVLGVIFYGLITPVAVFCRLLGRDELQMRTKEVTSFWINRTQPLPSAELFRNPF